MELDLASLMYQTGPSHKLKICFMPVNCFQLRMRPLLFLSMARFLKGVYGSTEMRTVTITRFVNSDGSDVLPEPVTDIFWAVKKYGVPTAIATAMITRPTDLMPTLAPSAVMIPTGTMNIASGTRTLNALEPTSKPNLRQNNKTSPSTKKEEEEEQPADDSSASSLSIRDSALFSLIFGIFWVLISLTQ